jgi:hypothetical protein
MPETIDFNALQHTTGEIPWSAIDAAVEALAADPSLLDSLLDRFKLITSDPYTIATFEYLYIPYILTLAAGRLPPDEAARIHKRLIDELEFFGDLDDDAMLEFLMYCGVQMGSAILPTALEKVRDPLFDATSSAWFHMWPLLETALKSDDPAIRKAVADFSLNTLQDAEKGRNLTNPGDVVDAGRILAQLDPQSALPVVESLVRKCREGSDRLRGSIREFEEIVEAIREQRDLEKDDHPDLRSDLTQRKQHLEAWYRDRPADWNDEDWNDEEFEEPDAESLEPSLPSHLPPHHRAALEGVSESVPWQGLDAIISEAAGNANLRTQLVARLRDLYNGDPYKLETFEVVYLPYVLTELAGRADVPGEDRRKLIDLLLETSRACWEREDEAAAEFLDKCVQVLPLEDVAPVVLETLREHRVHPHAISSIALWELLGNVHTEGTPELQAQMRDLALRTLEEAIESPEVDTPGAEYAGYRLADLRYEPAVPLLEKLESRSAAAGSMLATISARSYRDAIQIIQGRKDDYKERPPVPLRQLVEEERAQYAQWYRERDQQVPTVDVSPPIGRLLDTAVANELPDSRPIPIRNLQEKVGRNDPCPCGSGKKYKKCCGKN